MSFSCCYRAPTTSREVCSSLVKTNQACYNKAGLLLCCYNSSLLDPAGSGLGSPFGLIYNNYFFLITFHFPTESFNNTRDSKQTHAERKIVTVKWLSNQNTESIRGMLSNHNLPCLPLIIFNEDILDKKLIVLAQRSLLKLCRKKTPLSDRAAGCPLKACVDQQVKRQKYISWAQEYQWKKKKNILFTVILLY